MNPTPASASCHLTRTAVLLCAALTPAALVAQANSSPIPAATRSDPRDPSTYITRYFQLHNAGQVNDANEILTGLRLILDPYVKLYLIPHEQIIAIRAAPDQIADAEKFLAETDKPRKSYRITYTITDRDGTRVVGVQHFSMFMVVGSRTTLRSGSKVPVVTGSTTQEGHAQNQMTYLDVGLSFDATIEASQDQIRLNSKVEQSSIVEDKTGLTQQDPVVRQTILEGTFTTTPGKPTLLGSVDTPGSTRHLDIEAIVEPAK